MKIAHITPLLPIQGLPRMDGLQEVVIDLSRELLCRDHLVTLFARDENVTPGVPTAAILLLNIFSTKTVFPAKKLRTFLTLADLYLDLYFDLQRRTRDFDVLLVHGPSWVPLIYSLLLQEFPVIHTFQMPPNQAFIRPALRILHACAHSVTLITLSYASARFYAAYAPIDHNIYNSVDLNAIPFASYVSPQVALLIAGRICRERGQETAIEIAECANQKLVIAGPIQNREYYNACLTPRIDASGGRIAYVGASKREQLWQPMSQSSGLLYPIQWEELLSLVGLEALATGTPVIAFRRDATEEMICDGGMGFLIKPGDIAGAVAHVHDLASISRVRCRQSVQSQFTLECMYAYERLYLQVVASHFLEREATLIQHTNDLDTLSSPSRLAPRFRPSWVPLLDTALREHSLEVIHLIAERLRDPNSVLSVAEQAKQQTRLEHFFSWGSPSFNHLGSMALLYLFLNRSFLKEGWQEPVQQYLHLAAQRTQQSPLLVPGLYNGSSGLALALATFCQEEPRYQRALDTLNERICRQVLDLPLPTLPGSVAFHNYDVIGGAAGILGYLITLRDSTSHVQEAISTLARYLVWLSGEQKPGCPNWLIAPTWMREQEREQYPKGNYNLGLAHGIPGPLAALSLAWQSGYRFPGQREAIKRISRWIRSSALTDGWGINWLNALPKNSASASKLLLPTRAACCYWVPGIASALRLAGQALEDKNLPRVAVESLETVCRRPVEARRIPSPTLCHGASGLLAIYLRFAQVSSSQELRAQIPLLATEILAACDPKYPLVVRDEEIPGSFADGPSFLNGAVGVALVLLAASTPMQPTWDRMLMIA